MHPKIKIHASEESYRGFVQVRKYDIQFQLFDGGWSSNLQREVVLRGDAVVVLPYDPDTDQVLMIEQFRLPAHCKDIDPWLLELPAGMVDDGESLRDVAMRETFEETGLRVTQLKPLHHFLASPGILAETLHLWVGRVDLSLIGNGHPEIHGKADEGENIRLRPVKFSDIANLLNENKVTNATAMLGLYWLLQNRNALRKEWGL